LTRCSRKICIVIFSFLLFGCKSAGANIVKEASGYIPVKYPIILVHGIAFHDRGVRLNAWNRIPQKLRENGVQVYYGNTDSWGSYETNADILKTTIDSVLVETESGKVNIIAHSKGGLDARYCIWKYDYWDKVASLITISTPHLGSEIADEIFNGKLIHSRLAMRTLEIFGSLYRDTNPDMYNVNYELTTANMNEFNEKVLWDDRVYFVSMYTTLRNPLDDPAFFSSYRFLKKASGDNDGLVSEHSVHWGNNTVKIASGISHNEIIDQRIRKIAGKDIPEIYLKLADLLSKMGF